MYSQRYQISKKLPKTDSTFQVREISKLWSPKLRRVDCIFFFFWSKMHPLGYPFYSNRLPASRGTVNGCSLVMTWMDSQGQWCSAIAIRCNWVGVGHARDNTAEFYNGSTCKGMGCVMVNGCLRDAFARWVSSGGGQQCTHCPARCGRSAARS